MKKYLVACLAIAVMIALGGCDEIKLPSLTPDEPEVTEKPVIYLYPETETDVTVKLDFDGELFVTYPAYDETIGGWEVTAHPDGTLIHDGNEYSYLFWDGFTDTAYDFSKGFVVAGADTESFLVEKLQYLGLNPTEYNEFIVYWLPQMMVMS